MPDTSIGKVQPQPGATYRVIYNYSDGKQREAVAQFVGLEEDPVVANPDSGKRDKVTLHFILMSPTIRDLARQNTFTIDAPPEEPIHFHLWPEDLVRLESLAKGEPT